MIGLAAKIFAQIAVEHANISHPYIHLNNTKSTPGFCCKINSKIHKKFCSLFNSTTYGYLYPSPHVIFIYKRCSKISKQIIYIDNNRDQLDSLRLYYIYARKFMLIKVKVKKIKLN